MDIYFRSKNKSKINEFQRMLDSKHIRIIPITKPINEIQSNNLDDIVIDKVVKAFKDTMRPVIVEHTGLMLKDFGGLPGGLAQLFWDSLKADKFAAFFAHTGSAQAIVKTVIAYCDGRQITTFDGETDGQIVDPPRGSREFQWDCVFQPNEHNLSLIQTDEFFDKDGISMKGKISMKELTFAQMDVLFDKDGISMKDRISMRRIAIEKLKKYLEAEIHD